MAVAVNFRAFTPDNSRDDLVRRIGQAPVEHALAVLAAYELLEQLHDKGILDIVNGMLRAGDTVVDHVASLVSSKEAVTALRVGLIFSSLLSTIDVDKLHAVMADAGKKPPSLLSIGKLALSADAKRAMAMGLGLLNVFGAALGKGKKHDHHG
jgi:uncharacterized protein YjgD (DUF1641 family)